VRWVTPEAARLDWPVGSVIGWDISLAEQRGKWRESLRYTTSVSTADRGHQRLARSFCAGSSSLDTSRGSQSTPGPLMSILRVSGLVCEQPRKYSELEWGDSDPLGRREGLPFGSALVGQLGERSGRVIAHSQ
jgi:hypothetical protein